MNSDITVSELASMAADDEKALSGMASSSRRYL